jgi:hypothetical protein
VACGGGGDGRVSVAELENAVLQPADLPAVFERFDEGRVALADTPPGPRGDSARFGREDGWKSRYRRPGTSATAGPLVVESRVDVFEEEDGAERDLDAYRAEWSASGQDETELDLGDEAFSVTSLQPGTPRGVRFFQIAWRQANASASLTVNGFEGKLRLAEALALARKQERRIADAAANG